MLLIGHGEDHPEMGLIDSNLGLILQAIGEYDNGVKFLECALSVNKKYFGSKSMKTALSYHLLGNLIFRNKTPSIRVIELILRVIVKTDCDFK